MGGLDPAVTASKAIHCSRKKCGLICSARNDEMTSSGTNKWYDEQITEILFNPSGKIFLPTGRANQPARNDVKPVARMSEARSVAVLELSRISLRSSGLQTP